MDYFDSGFCVREPSWHRKELLLDKPPATWAEARPLAGLDWEPVAEPVYRASRHSGIGNVVTPGYHHIVRDDNDAVLTVAKDGYQLISHEVMGDLIDAFMGADANVKFETAGSVKGGALVWALVRLDEPYQVTGDDSLTYPYLALLNAHDGSASCSFTLTSVRVVCWNTWQAADQEGARNGSRYVIRHTGDMEAKVQEAKGALAQLRDSAHQDRELFESLAQQPVSDEQVKTFAALFLPSPRDAQEHCSDRVHANALAARATFLNNYEEGVTLDGIRGTAYGLLQAATEQLDHIRKAKSKDSHIGRTILRPEAFKLRALNLIGDVVSGAA